MPTTAAARPATLIESQIFLIRGLKVLIDADLATLYGVQTKNLNLAVRRNRSRFPKDFMFQLSAKEASELQNLRLQIETSSSLQKKTHGGRRYYPYAFTEQGVAMLSSVLTSKRAINVNIAIMRAFVRLRQLVAGNETLAHRMNEIERTQIEQSTRIDKQSHIIEQIFTVVKKLATPEVNPNKRRVGFPVSRVGSVERC